MKKILYTLMFIIVTICVKAQQQNAATSETELPPVSVMNNYSVVSMFGGIRNNGFQRGIDLQAKDRSVYAIEKSNLVFYRRKSGRTINYAGGDYVILQGENNQYRYKYSNLTKKIVHPIPSFLALRQIHELLAECE